MHTLMTWQEFKSNLGKVGYLQKEIKRRCMMYHVDLKEDVAKQLGLPHWAFYHMAYKDLGLLRDSAAALQWFNEHREWAERRERESFMRTHCGEDWEAQLRQQLTLALLEPNLTAEKRQEYEAMLKDIQEESHETGD